MSAQVEPENSFSPTEKENSVPTKFPAAPVKQVTTSSGGPPGQSKPTLSAERRASNDKVLPGPREASKPVETNAAAQQAARAAAAAFSSLAPMPPKKGGSIPEDPNDEMPSPRVGSRQNTASRQNTEGSVYSNSSVTLNEVDYHYHFEDSLEGEKKRKEIMYPLIVRDKVKDWVDLPPPAKLLPATPDILDNAAIDPLDDESLENWPRNKRDLAKHLPNKVNRYLQEFKLHSTTSRMIEKLLVEMPENPYQFLYEQVTAHLRSHYDIISKTTAAGPELVEQVDAYNYQEIEEFTELTPDNPDSIQTFSRTKSMKAVMFLDAALDRDRYVCMKSLHEFIEKNPDVTMSVTFFYINSNSLTHQIRSHMRVPIGMTPAFSVMDPSNGHIYAMRDLSNISDATLHPFLRDLLKGKLSPTPVPVDPED